MKEASVFRESLDLYNNFLDSVRKVKYGEITNCLVDFLEDNENKKPKIISLGRGRTGLSGISGLQELYNHLEETPYEFVPYSMEKDPINRHIRKDDLVLVESGSGNTKETIDDFKKALEVEANCIAIVGKENSTIYECAEEHRIPILLLKSERKKENDISSPMGSEFEFKYWMFHRCSTPEILNKLGLSSDSYEKRFNIYRRNAKCLHEIKDENISEWIDRLTNRYGIFVFDGVDQSGHVAEQFEMRFRHLGYEPFMYKDSNRKVFKKGCCYIPITGSGNTEDVVKRARDDAIKKGADVMPITANLDSEIAKIVRDEKDLLYIPILSEFQESLKNYSSDDRISPPKGYKPRIPFFETNAYIVTNCIVAQIAHNDGKLTKFMEHMHV